MFLFLVFIKTKTKKKRRNGINHFSVMMMHPEFHIIYLLYQTRTRINGQWQNNKKKVKDNSRPISKTIMVDHKNSVKIIIINLVLIHPK